MPKVYDKAQEEIKRIQGYAIPGSESARLSGLAANGDIPAYQAGPTGLRMGQAAAQWGLKLGQTPPQPQQPYVPNPDVVAQAQAQLSAAPKVAPSGLVGVGQSPSRSVAVRQTGPQQPAPLTDERAAYSDNGIMDTAERLVGERQKAELAYERQIREGQANQPKEMTPNDVDKLVPPPMDAEGYAIEETPSQYKKRVAKARQLWAAFYNPDSVPDEQQPDNPAPQGGAWNTAKQWAGQVAQQRGGAATETPPPQSSVVQPNGQGRYTLPTPNSAEEWKALPKGTHYRDKDGNERIKR